MFAYPHRWLQIRIRLGICQVPNVGKVALQPSSPLLPRHSLQVPNRGRPIGSGRAKEIARNLIPSTGETLLARNRGVLHRQHSIKLCTFTYKFISKLHSLSEIASSSHPLTTRSTNGASTNSTHSTHTKEGKSPIS
jgi:hypothetical protein